MNLLKLNKMTRPKKFRTIRMLVHRLRKTNFKYTVFSILHKWHLVGKTAYYEQIVPNGDVCLLNITRRISSSIISADVRLTTQSVLCVDKEYFYSKKSNRILYMVKDNSFPFIKYSSFLEYIGIKYFNSEKMILFPYGEIRKPVRIMLGDHQEEYTINISKILKCEMINYSDNYIEDKELLYIFDEICKKYEDALGEIKIVDLIEKSIES